METETGVVEVMSTIDSVYSGPWGLVLTSEAWEVLRENDGVFRERLDSTVWDDLAIAWQQQLEEKDGEGRA